MGALDTRVFFQLPLQLVVFRIFACFWSTPKCAFRPVLAGRQFEVQTARDTINDVEKKLSQPLWGRFVQRIGCENGVKLWLGLGLTHHDMV